MDVGRATGLVRSFVGSIVGIACLVSGCADDSGESPTGQQRQPLEVAEWPLHALTVNNSAFFEDRAQLSGNVAVVRAATGPVLADNAEFTMGADAKLFGNALGDTVVLRERAKIHGTAQYNGVTLGTGAAILGGGSSPLALPLAPLPALPAITPGSAPITVAGRQTLVRAAGQYGVVTLSNGIPATPTRLTLTGGVYHFQSLTVNNDARVECTNPCEVRVAGRVRVGQRSFLGSKPGIAGLGPGNTQVLVAGSNGAAGPWGEPGAVVVDHDSTLDAYLLAPNGTTRLGHRVRFRGKIATRDAVVGSEHSGEGLQLALIDQQPLSITVREDELVSFSVHVSNPAGVSYRWQRNGVDVPGAAGAGSTYSYSPALVSDDGAQFRVKVINAAGTVVSSSATLTVIPCYDEDATCDSFDDDCDGTEDEEFGPVCDASGTVELNCVDGAVTSLVCSNADVCDGVEFCGATGTCQDGPPAVVDDDNSCTADSCDPITGVAHVPLAAGSLCDDGDYDNGDELCDGAGACLPAIPAEAAGARPMFRARWVYPNGEPVRSFSARPPASGSAALFSRRAARAPVERVVRELDVTSSQGSQGMPGFAGYEVRDGVAAGPREQRARDPESFRAAWGLTPGTEPLSASDLTLEIENLSADELGTTVAYSVMVRTWYGNIWADSIVQAVDPAVTIAPRVPGAPAPGASVPVHLPTHLLVRMPNVAAKADVIVALHRLDGFGTPEPEPFTFTAGESFYYNYNDDFSGVYTYGLEDEPVSTAPRRGLSQRYTPSSGSPWLGDDMFLPDGNVAGVPAADAVANLKSFLIGLGFHGTVYSTRPDVHDVDTNGALIGPIPGPIPPAGVPRADGVGGTQPWDGVSPPTTLCPVWSTSYIDSGTEALPNFPTPDVWQNTVDFVPASFAYADLYEADGDALVTLAPLDANGCFPPLNLGPGLYYVRAFSSMDSGSSKFVVERTEPGRTSSTSARGKVTSVTMALDLFDTGPGTTLYVGAGLWGNETNVAAVGSHLLQRNGAIDMGVVPSSTPRRMLLNLTFGTALFNDLSRYSPSDDTLFIMPSPTGWAHDARWKFVVGHELGHMAEDFFGVPQASPWYFYDGDVPRQTPGTDDPASASMTPELTANCTCGATVDAAAHCLQSMEESGTAIGEGFGHFYASRLWNLLPSEGGTSCNFEYYKAISGTSLTTEPTPPPVGVDCGVPHGLRDAECNAVTIVNSSMSPMSHSSEVDWLTYFWDLATNPLVDSGGGVHQVTMSQLMQAYADIGNLNGLMIAENFSFVLIDSGVLPDDAAIRDQLTAKGIAHAVQNSAP